MKQIGQILLIMSILSHYSFGSEQTSTVNSLRLCSNALDSCSDLVKEQSNQISLMNQELRALESQVIEQEDKNELPVWVWVGLGVVVGGVATKLILR